MNMKQYPNNFIHCFWLMFPLGLFCLHQVFSLLTLSWLFCVLTLTSNQQQYLKGRGFVSAHMFPGETAPFWRSWLHCDHSLREMDASAQLSLLIQSCPPGSRVLAPTLRLSPSYCSKPDMDNPAELCTDWSSWSFYAPLNWQSRLTVPTVDASGCQCHFWTCKVLLCFSRNW